MVALPARQVVAAEAEKLRAGTGTAGTISRMYGLDVADVQSPELILSCRSRTTVRIIPSSPRGGLRMCADWRFLIL